MKLLDLSGASTKIVSHAGACLALKQLNYYPNVIVGVSSGAIASIPVALGLHNELKQYSINLKLDDFFDIAPINNKGRIKIPNAISRILQGKNSLGVQNVSKLISKVITPEIFEIYKLGTLYADCYALAINIDTGQREYFNLKKLSYQKYLKVMEATSAIPFATEPIEIDGHRYYDGGVFDHIGGKMFLEKYNTMYNFKEVVTVFSRPKDNIAESSPNWDKNMATVADRLWQMNIANISKDDEMLQKEYCLNQNIQLKQLFMPKILGSLYDTDNQKLEQLYHQSYVEALKQYKD